MSVDATPAVVLPSEPFWLTLITAINEGKVIPILGEDLVVVEHENKRQPLHSLLARRLATELGVELAQDAKPTVAQVALAYKRKTNNLEEVYAPLFKVLKELQALPIPEPLLTLARILPFRLFVTTTIDDFLQRAIDQERSPGEAGTTTTSFCPSDTNDLPEPFAALAQPTVFHLLGKASGTPLTYAVTEEDVLEFVHCLASKGPQRLRSALNENTVLIIGTGYPDWLARFFVRLAQENRLSETRRKPTKTVIVDQSVQPDAALYDFLTQVSGSLQIFNMDPADFAEQLFTRWKPTHTPSLTSQPSAEDQAPGDNNLVATEGEESKKTEQQPDECVFVSYAHEDRLTAEKLVKGLEKLNVPVWFDRKQIEGGEPWRAEIDKGLHGCSLFTALVSKYTLTTKPREFRDEWNFAQERAAKLLPNQPFIVPILIDDTSRETIISQYPSFNKPHWQTLEGDQVDEVATHIRNLFRQVRNSQQ